MSTGILYIVATPLGNLEDMSFRAVRILQEVKIIAAEDTRHSRRLLDHYGISTPAISCHEHNENQRLPQLLQKLENGENIALISDAGTPCISDPGYHLVKAAGEKGFSVIPIPGCSAAIAGLSVSGLPTDSFAFHGFLPKKKQQQAKALESLKPQKETLIFYESPRRILSLLERILSTLGDRQACLAREITKRHEEYLRGSVSHLISILGERESIKGECALFVQGQTQEKKISMEELEGLIKAALAKDPDQPTSGLAKSLAAAHPVPKKQIYNLILKLRD